MPKDAKGHGSDPRGGGPRRPIPGHPYHSKTNDELRYIAKDAGEAARNMRGVDDKAEGKYLDQVNDAATVLHYRSQGGTSDALTDKSAAKSLAGGGDKSAAVQVHSAMGGGKKVYIDRHPDIGEFKVHAEGAPKSHGYFTNDKADAVATAKHMHGDNATLVHRSKRYDP